LSAAGILARIRCLDQLSRGLAKEIQLVERADNPMLYVERKEYLTAMRKVRAGIEDALVVLAKAKQRIVRYSRPLLYSFVPGHLGLRRIGGAAIRNGCRMAKSKVSRNHDLLCD
jgi:hypothetical protein